MKKTALLAFIIIFVSAASCFAESKWAVGVEGTGAIARLDMDNNLQVNFGYSSTFADTDDNSSNLQGSLLVLNKITTNTFWKIGGGLAMLNGKMGGASYSGTAMSFIMGAEYRISERFVLDFQVTPLSFVSASVSSSNSSSSTILQGTVGATITL